MLTVQEHYKAPPINFFLHLASFYNILVSCLVCKIIKQTSISNV